MTSALVIALVLGLSYWVGKTSKATAALGVLLALMLAMHLAAGLGARWFFAQAPHFSGIDPVGLEQLVEAFAWLHRQSEQTVTLFGSLWGICVLAQSLRARE